MRNRQNAINLTWNPDNMKVGDTKCATKALRTILEAYDKHQDNPEELLLVVAQTRDYYLL